MGVIRDHQNSRRSLTSDQMMQDFNDLLEENNNLNVGGNHHHHNNNNHNLQVANGPLSESMTHDHNNLSAGIADQELRRHEKKMRKIQREYKNKCQSAKVRPEPTFRGLGCRGRSSRKHRQYENGNLLAQSLGAYSLEMDDMTDEIDIYDFVPRTVSAFAKLLREKENMKAWNDFIIRSEEDQQIILDKVDQDDSDDDSGEEADGVWCHSAKGGRRRRTYNSVGDTRDMSHEHRKDDSDSDGQHDSDDQNNRRHPAYSPDMSFERIDARIKNMLRRQKRLPMGLLVKLEEEISTFFESEGNDAIYQSCLPTSFQRLLLHATSQYLNLVCRSYDRHGSRWSKVENENDHFSRPSMQLADYLETSVFRIKNQTGTSGYARRKQPESPSDDPNDRRHIHHLDPFMS